MVDLECSGSVHPRHYEETQGRNIYNVNDKPPCIFSFLNALQILICQALNLIWVPLKLMPFLCLLPADPIRVYLVSTAFLTSGIVTSMQSTLGIRLPTVAVPSVLYTFSLKTLLQSTRFQCPSNGDLYAMGPELRSLEWQSRLRELQGALLFAGILQAVLGFSGLQARLCQLLSPVTVAPVVILIGLTTILENMKDHWMLVSIIAVFIILFSLRLQEVSFPMPTFSLQSGLTTKCYPVFRIFPVLWTSIAVYIVYEVWIFFSTRTPYPDTEFIGFQEAIDNSKWFFFPFPYEWGLPTLSLATVAHLLPAVLLQSITSFFLFYANANTCGLGTPPRSAVSRGLGMEGFGLLLGSLWGHSTTTDATNISLMSFTGVMSRSSTQLAALMMIFFSHFTRLTSMIASIPIQFVYALHLFLHTGLVCGGISILRFINFNSPRDCSVVGLSLFFGMVVPQWMAAGLILNTGLPELDSLIYQGLASSVCVAALTGCLLDLCLPGRINSYKSHPWRFRSEEDKNTYRRPTWEELLCSILDQSPFFSSD